MLSLRRWIQLSSGFLANFIISYLLINSCCELAAAAPNSSSSSSLITFLPGFNGALPFQLHTGYVDVGEEEDETHLFYYFIESETNPREDPLLLWLTGGPGCSAFSGLVFEIGPLVFEAKEYDDATLPSLAYNPYSWTQVANIIFLDAPSGTGFSYSDTMRGYITGDFKAMDDVQVFLIKWLELHPDFVSNPVYIGGDSYSGYTVPYLTLKIADGNRNTESNSINLKGYLVGNPSTDPRFDFSQVPFAHGMGLISEELYKATKISCKGHYALPSNADCASNLNEVFDTISGLYSANILEPTCPLASPNPGASLRVHRGLHEIPSKYTIPPIIPPSYCREYVHALSYFWGNAKIVQDALQVREGSIQEWLRCNFSVRSTYSSDIISSLEYHRNLTMRGFRALVYSGDHDLLVPFVGTQRWVSSFNYKIVDKWRSWLVDGQVAGFTKSYEHNLTYATVKGAGHTAPEYKPKECLSMVQRWFSNAPL